MSLNFLFTDMEIEHIAQKSSVKKQKLDQNSITEKVPSSNSSFTKKVNVVEKNESPSESEPLPIVAFNPNTESYQKSGPSVAAASEISPAQITIPCGIDKIEPVQSINIKPSADQQCDAKSSPELMMQCKMIVDKAMQKHTVVRSSFETVVLELLNTKQMQKQSMEKDLKNQREEYDEIIASLRKQVDHLTAECVVLKSQNSELTTQNTQSENIRLKAELETANGKMVKLQSKLNEMVSQNGSLSAQLSELQELKAANSNMHQKMKRSMASLQTASEEMASNGKDLREKFQELRQKFEKSHDQSTPTELKQLKLQNQWQKIQMEQMQVKFDRTIRDRISEAKKLVWCVDCGNPSEPHHCYRCRLAKMSK